MIIAEACHFVWKNIMRQNIINVGTGSDLTIKHLADTIADVVGYDGDINLGYTKPNGTLRKVLNVDKLMSLGWEPKLEFAKEFIKHTNGLKKIMIGLDRFIKIGRLEIKCFNLLP
jgi:hypothetical protein